MDLKPATPWEWTPLVRRLRFRERDTLLVALLMATYGGGTRIEVSVERLMKITGRSKATICRCRSELRSRGLIEPVRNGSDTGVKGGSSEYRITLPADLWELGEMLPPDDYPPVTTSHP